MKLDDDEVESLWLININAHRSKRPILVGAIYRPPGSRADTDAKNRIKYRGCLPFKGSRNVCF